MSRQTPVALLGSVALPGGPTILASADPELGPEVGAVLLPTDAAPSVRTLSGRLHKPEGMSRWSRLDRYGRALAAACAGLTPRGLGADSGSGLYVASERSCLETNATFDRQLLEKGPERASPFVFPYTLPGATAAEVALHFGLRGEHLVFPGGPATALAMVLSACDALAETHLSPTPLVLLSADVLGAYTLLHEHLDGRADGSTESSPTGSAAQGTPGAADNASRPPPALAEAAAALWLAPAADPRPGPRFFLDGLLLPAALSPTELRGAVDALVGRSLGGTPPELFLSASADLTACRRDQALAADLPGCDWAQPVWTLGNCGASLGLLTLCQFVESTADTLLLCGSDNSLSVVLVARRA